jgi:endonuclease VIII
MPEGPEIKLAADKIAKAIRNVPITEVFFAFDTLKEFEKILASYQVVSVKPKGKALLIRFSNDLSIYSHNQLYGVWLVRAPYNYPNTNRQLRLAIHTHKKSALLYSASDISVLNDTEIAVHPFLTSLGLDVLDEATTIEQVQARFTEKQFYRRGLAPLLLNQHFLCGLGNYLRSEILFVANVNPTLRPVDCTERQIERLAEATLVIPRKSYFTKGITNDITIANKLKATGKPRQAYRHWVFGRDNQPCHVCGTSIVKTTLAGRRLYYCPQCQK